MKTRKKTKSGLFIVESLTFEDEKRGYFEGEVISKILNFAQIEHSYFYIRTRDELIEIVEMFRKSNFRYLHISCHGNSKAIYTTLDEILISDLVNILEKSLDDKRLFLSACSATNDKLANKIFEVTNCISIIGPNKNIYMEDAVIFWSSFYQLMFKQNSLSMNQQRLKTTLTKLVDIHNVLVKFYTSSSSNTGWKEIELV